MAKVTTLSHTFIVHNKQCPENIDLYSVTVNNPLWFDHYFYSPKNYAVHAVNVHSMVSQT